MTTVLAFLKGKKTFILVGLALVVLACKHFGLLDPHIADELLGALGLGSLVTLRLAVSGE